VLVAIVLLFVTADAWHMLARPFDVRFWTLFGLLTLISGLLTLISGLLAVKTAASADVLHLIDLTMADSPTKVSRFNPAHVMRKAGCKADIALASAQDVRYLRRLLAAASAFQVVGVGFWVALSLTVVGTTSIDGALARELIGAKADILLTLPGHLIVTRELISISISLGAFAALYYAAVGPQDDDGRTALLNASTRTMRRVSETILLYRAGILAVEHTLGRLP